MPVVGLALDELFRYLGRSLAPDALEHELHRFGCSVEGWANVVRYRCPHCGAVVEAPEFEAVPPLCDSCGGDLRLAGLDVPELGRVHVLRMELLAVRPDLFDAPGLARALRGFLGVELGAPRYSLVPGEHVIEVEPGVAAVRSRIAAATVHGVAFDDASLRSLMKLQENIHWALGRDRKLASIGVYDLARVSGPALRYRAVGRDALRFVPLGYDPQAADSAMTPHEILERHPKGRAFAWLLPGSEPVPLLEDSRGGVLSMPPIINSEATRVTRETTDVLIDVTGHSDRHVERALAIVVASLLETCPGARARTVAIRYEHETRITPDFTPQPVPVEPREASRLIGVPWSRETVVDLLRRMRHDVRDEGGPLTVLVPAWRADILHPRDLIEDCAIAHGYDRIEPVALTHATFGVRHPREESIARARAALVGQGFLEVMTLALSSEDATYARTGLPNHERHVMLQHPISIEQTMVRVSTLPGLMETLAVNLGRTYPQRICEVGLVAEVDDASETGATERAVAALALAGDGLGYADVRAAVDALLRDLGARDRERIRFVPFAAPIFLDGRGAAIERDGDVLGLLGEVHPAVLENYRVVHPVAVAELDLARL